jgi:hypothetical protein
VGDIVGGDVGATVGAVVGSDDGGDVGAAVGAIVGDIVGAIVGDIVGGDVGATVGAVVGATDGFWVLILGFFEGAREGNAVGSRVGKCVGTAVGYFVGLFVGLLIGRFDGWYVGLGYEGLNVAVGTRFAIKMDDGADVFSLSCGLRFTACWISWSCKIEGSAMWPVTGIIGGVPIISATLAVDVWSRAWLALQMVLQSMPKRIRLPMDFISKTLALNDYDCCNDYDCFQW